MHKSSTVVLSGKSYEVDRAKLRLWLQLEDIREKIARAADKQDRSELSNSIYSYLSVALSITLDFASLPWTEIIEAYVELISLNRPERKFPLLEIASARREEVSWNYEGRTWYSWSHMLAGSYGWTIEYISEMDIDDAIAHLQEILTTEQLEREWQWLMSSKSVIYDKRGKGKFQELERPEWMSVPKKPVTEGPKIKRSVLPVGNVVRWADGGNIDA